MTNKQILNDIVKNGANPKSPEAQRYSEALEEVNKLSGLDQGTLEGLAAAEWSLKPFGGLNFINSFIDYYTEVDENTGELSQDPDKLAVILLVKDRFQKVLDDLSMPSPVPPKTSSGVPICVVPVGEIEEQAGVSVGERISRNGKAGTLGAVVTERNNTSKGFILSNRHVMAPENSPQVGQVIHRGGQPVAKLFSWSQIRDPYVDAALAFTNSDLVSPIPNDNPDLKINPDPILTDELQSMAAHETIRVTKVGAKSGITFGVVRARDIGVAVGVSGLERSAQIRISGSTQAGSIGISRRFSERGDSGSIVLESSSRRPIGLLFGGRGVTSYANLVENVVKTMQIEAFCDSSTDFDK